ncbi:hypothetical protein EXIGLDRAFT_734085 [Exidia glandulosa HHB12029]|uniref:Uncharacterized protein n=1 Tax=Exidia glandulosa HHB12029 TaxID=1314781 RepID=A0A165K986_EXIGL|nr:hypothetical protein EXIGLDRAFT_718450 [Exidia glandulosa HHB12029]KZV78067.1 hypothetical protein EXIGLDRAFT_718412 [Exidia glandulosa HHB12029]KZV95991.1 hypothetical protein EXIGLDRAFT_734085 [Exidia glandulosa HHB12029]
MLSDSDPHHVAGVRRPRPQDSPAKPSVGDAQPSPQTTPAAKKPRFGASLFSPSRPRPPAASAPPQPSEQPTTPAAIPSPQQQPAAPPPPPAPPRTVVYQPPPPPADAPNAHDRAWQQTKSTARWSARDCLYDMRKAAVLMADVRLVLPTHKVHEDELKYIEMMRSAALFIAGFTGTILERTGHKIQADPPAQDQPIATPGPATTTSSPPPPPAQPPQLPTSTPAPAQPVSTPPSSTARAGHRQRQRQRNPRAAAPPLRTSPPAATQQRAHTLPSRTPRRSDSRARSTRLIIRFPGPLEKRQLHPATVRDSLNDALHDRWVSAVDLSRGGHLVLRTRAPFTARQLAVHGDLIWTVIQKTFELPDEMHPLFEPDDQWTSIVVHRVPLPIWDDARAAELRTNFFSEVCEWNGLDPKSLKKERFLCKEDDLAHRVQGSSRTTPQRVSVMLTVSDTAAAHRLLQTGVFWQGSHCRASLYRAKQS